MGSGEKSRIIHRRDVPWHRNGTIMKFIFMVAGLGLVMAMLVDPEFPRTARPGLLDVLIGLVMGNLCGWPAGRMMAHAYECDTQARLSLWQEMRKRSFDRSKLVYAGLFLLAVPGAGAASAYLSRRFYLGVPWFGEADFISAGTAITSMIFFLIAIARGVERWHRSLPE